MGDQSARDPMWFSRRCCDDTTSTTNSSKLVNDLNKTSNSRRAIKLLKQRATELIIKQRRQSITETKWSYATLGELPVAKYCQSCGASTVKADRVTCKYCGAVDKWSTT